MRAYMTIFNIGLRQASRDYMLGMLLIAPVLCGIVFNKLVPKLEAYLVSALNVDRLIAPYYILFDILLVLLTPFLICMTASFIILEEKDDQVTPYYYVTPAGFFGYIIARLVMPAIFSCILSLIVLMLFKLTPIPVTLGIALALISTLYALAITLTVVSYATNKVEGLALTKLAGITFLGVLAPYFIKGNSQYIFAAFPSFWLTKVALEYSSTYFPQAVAGGIVCSLAWIFFAKKKL